MKPAKIEFVSDSSLLIEFAGPAANESVHALMNAWTIEDEIAIENFHPAYASLLVDFDPAQITPDQLLKHIDLVLARRGSAKKSSRPGIEISVYYGGQDGPDLSEIASSCGLTQDEVIRRHSEAEYTVAFLGFIPGFPYLNGLPSELACARLPTPRLKVRAGSVGIGGPQTGIYPADSPGGWKIIGRTPRVLFDPHRNPASILAPGDRVRFKPVVLSEQGDDSPVKKIPPGETLSAAIEVISGGFFSTIQDLGRTHQAHYGIARAGAADPLAIAVGNRLVGNTTGAAAIEMTAMGGSFKFLERTWIAVAGADCAPALDGQSLAMWTSFPVERGQTLLVGSLDNGARAYLCIHGGVGVVPVLGSRATFVSGSWGGFEGRELRGGDRIPVGGQRSGPPGYRRASGAIRKLYRQTEFVLRATVGPQVDWFTDGARKDFFSKELEVTTDANRRGIRLRGPSLAYESAYRNRELVTEGVANGSIQIPADGQPLVLFCEQQTTGGYAKIATVIRADWFRLGQLKPGMRLRFQCVDLEQAWRIGADFETMVARSVHAI